MTQKYNIINKIRSSPLFKHWERDYSIFFWSMTSGAHIAVNSPELGEGSLTLALFTYQNGIGAYYRLFKDNDNFFAIIGKKLKENKAFNEDIFTQYSYFGEKLNSINQRIETLTSISSGFIREYAQSWKGIVTYQLIVHRIIDYLVQFPECKDLVRKFTAARIKFEKLFGYFQKKENLIFRLIAVQRQLRNPKILELFTLNELIYFTETGLTPTDVESRKSMTVISSVPKFEIFSGNDATELKHEVDVNLKKTADALAQNQSLMGTAVYGKGVIRGVAQVIKDYAKLDELKKGKILVAPSTLPKYEHFYKKAKAIITDEGGLLSHVAIFCREFKIPGVVGTKIATELFKDGDQLELDSDKGIVRRA